MVDDFIDGADITDWVVCGLQDGDETMKLGILVIAMMLLAISCGLGSAATTEDEYGVYTYSGGETCTWTNATKNANGKIFTKQGMQWQPGSCDNCNRDITGYWDGGALINKNYGNYACWSTGVSYTQVGYPTTLITNGKGLGTTNEWIGVDPPCSAPSSPHYTRIHFWSPTIDVFTISGSTCGVSNITLYINDTTYKDIDYSLLNSTHGDTYTFDIVNNTQYKIIFSDSTEYEFTVSGANIDYDRELCDYYTINFVDNCGNNLISPLINVYDETGTYRRIVNDSQPVNGQVKLVIGTGVNELEIGDSLYVLCESHIGTTIWETTCSAVGSYDYTVPNIAWNLQYTIKNGSAVVSDTKVELEQDCVITDAPSRQSFSSTDGTGTFTLLENDEYTLTIGNTSLCAFNQTLSGGFNAFIETYGVHIQFDPSACTGTVSWQNGTYNDSLANETNQTLPAGHTWGSGVYFRNVEGYITDTINDSDTHVFMHAWSNRDDGEEMILRFETETAGYYLPLLTYGLPNGTYTNKTILNDNFTVAGLYRGYLFSYTNESYNTYQILNVINWTNYSSQDLQNLTAYCWLFGKTRDDTIDYRTTPHITVYADSDNSTLLNINITFWNETTMVANEWTDWTDYTTGYHTYEPAYSYSIGYNYTVKIYSQGILIDSDTAYAMDIEGNTLTIFVRDQNNVYLPNCYIFVEDWGSYYTGQYLYYSAIQGLPDGTQRYKATKSGYIGGGWDSIVLSASDETVTYYLTAEGETGSASAVHLSNEEVKALYLPIMGLILISILLGAFIFVSSD